MPANRGVERPDQRRPGAPGRFLVTGAFGAIGVWTIRRLLERGHAVVGLDVGDDAHRLPIALDEDQIRSVALVRADITDLDALTRLLDLHGITGVIHLAALQVPFVLADPARGVHVNVAGTTNVLEAVRRAGIARPVVYASSIAAFGRRGTLDGTDPPGTLYGVCKRANEGTALRYHEDYGVSSIGLRPHTVYGPARDQGITSAPSAAMLAAVAGVPFRIPFGGSVQLQYAPDVGEAFVRAAELAPEGASVHNLDGPEVAIAELVEVIEKTLPTARGLISADHVPLPFPGTVDATSFVELMGGSVMRPLPEGVADALRRFERLLSAGVVPHPAPSRGSVPAT